MFSGRLSVRPSVRPLTSILPDATSLYFVEGFQCRLTFVNVNLTPAYIDHEDLSLLSDLTYVSSSFPSSPLSPSNPLLILSSTPGSKLIFSTNPFLYSSSTFPPIGLTPRTPAVFRFSRVCRF